MATLILKTIILFIALAYTHSSLTAIGYRIELKQRRIYTIMSTISWLIFYILNETIK